MVHCESVLCKYGLMQILRSVDVIDTGFLVLGFGIALNLIQIRFKRYFLNTFELFEKN